MRPRFAVLGGAILATLTATPSALAADGVPLRYRDGVIVAWQARSKSAVVVLPNRRVLVIHALRTYTPGTRVRVQGVKWGAAVEGVKWGLQPSGVKWGIAVARNGTYSSGLVPRGAARTMALRATVIRRSSKTLVLSAPGATFVLPIARNAVWLPTAKRRLAANNLRMFGTTVDATLRVAGNGKLVVTRVVEVSPPVAGTVVPVAGKVLHRDTGTRVLKIQAGGSSGVVVTITVPESVDLTKYPNGSEVAGTVAPGALGENGELVLTGISLNSSFAAADAKTSIGAVVPPGSPSAGVGSVLIDPNQMPQIDVPPPPPPTSPLTDPVTLAQVDMARALQASWTQARADGKVKFVGLYEGMAALLRRVEIEIASGRKNVAVIELAAFELAVGFQIPLAIDPAYKAQVITQSTALRVHLLTN